MTDWPRGHGHCHGGAAATRTRDGLAGSRRGVQSGAGIRHARQGYLVESEAPRRHLRCPSPRMVGVHVALYLLSACTAALLSTKTVWPFACGTRWCYGRSTAVSPSGKDALLYCGSYLLLQPSRGHAAVAEAHTHSHISPSRARLAHPSPPPSSAWGKGDAWKARFGLGSKCLLTSL